MTETHGLIVHSASDPPSNEIPAVLDPLGVRWEADGVAVAVPSCLVYTTGVALTVMCRTREPRSRETFRELADAVRSGIEGKGNDQGLRFAVNGKPVILLGGEQRNFGWTFPVWVRRPDGDIVVAFEWAARGIARAEHRIPGEAIADAASRAVVLW